MSEWAWSTGGIILTWENRSTRRETCLSATLFSIRLRGTGLGLNPGLRGERASTNRLVEVICKGGSGLELAQDRVVWYAFYYRLEAAFGKLMNSKFVLIRDVRFSQRCRWRFETREMLRRFFGWIFIDVLKDGSAAFIFSIERSKKRWNCFTLIMIALRYIETSVTF